MRWPCGVWTTGLLTAVTAGMGFWLLLEVGIRLGEVAGGR
jgi:hypothetical protein